MRNESFPNFKTYFSKLPNIFVLIDKFICPNFKMYLSYLTNLFVQISKFISPNCKINLSHAFFLHMRNQTRALHLSRLYFLPGFWRILDKLKIFLISYLLSTFKFPFHRFSLSTLIREMEAVQLQERSYIRCRELYWEIIIEIFELSKSSVKSETSI